MRAEIKEKFLRDAAEKIPKAARYLAAWTVTVKAARWRNSGGRAPIIPVRHGARIQWQPVIVFNVCGNTYRLIGSVTF